MLFFYAQTVLEDELPVTDAVDPLGGSFPGWLRVPAWLHPTDYTLLQALRPLTD